MKSIFITLSLLCSVCAFAQQLEIDSTTGKWMYRRVVKLDSIKAGDLHERAKQWMARAYVSADDVIQYDSKEEGKLIGRGVWRPAMSLNNEKNWHLLVIECRDGRVRYTFTDFVTETYDTTLGLQKKPLEAVKMFKKTTQQYYAKEAERMGNDLEKSLRAEQAAKSDGW